MNQDFAYLLGALGDGCLVHRQKKGEYCIEYEQKVESWLANSILPRIERLYGKHPRVTQRVSKLFRLRLYSKTAFEEFSYALQHLSLLLNEPASVKAQFIRGFFDAEGSVPKHLPGTSCRIEIYQKDRSKLELIARMLEVDFQISVGKITNSRDIGQLILYGRGKAELFDNLIGSEHPLKSRALHALFS